tara:strand:+ start:753 stop:1652 length:900 start_codon:yes stop_codon:yes gene_type:complete
MSDYQKYLKYKKKYLTAKKHLGGGKEKLSTSLKPKYPRLKSISADNSFSFIKNAEKKNIKIKSLPEGYKLPFKAYLGAPAKISSFENEMRNVLKYLKLGYLVNLTLQVSDESDKHAVLFYFDQDKKRIELWDSNGYGHGPLTRAYLESVLGHIRTNIIEGESVNFVVSDKPYQNINLLGAERGEDAGHCEALTLLYAVLRSISYDYAQNIYKISWENNNLGKKNMLLLNSYIQKKDYDSLSKLSKFNDLELIGEYFTPEEKTTHSKVKKLTVRKNISKKPKITYSKKKISTIKHSTRKR